MQKHNWSRSKRDSKLYKKYPANLNIYEVKSGTRLYQLFQMNGLVRKHMKEER